MHREDKEDAQEAASKGNGEVLHPLDALLANHACLLLLYLLLQLAVPMGRISLMLKPPSPLP